MDEIIEFAGIGEFIDSPVKVYSSGMAVRLGFAVAVKMDPEILIVDEALAVGDQAFRLRSEKRIREIRDNAGTVFLVSHSMSSIRDDRGLRSKPALKPSSRASRDRPCCSSYPNSR